MIQIFQIRYIQYIIYNLILFYFIKYIYYGKIKFKK
jgi:hypothetical protein